MACEHSGVTAGKDTNMKSKSRKVDIGDFDFRSADEKLRDELREQQIRLFRKEPVAELAVKSGYTLDQFASAGVLWNNMRDAAMREAACEAPLQEKYVGFTRKHSSRLNEPSPGIYSLFAGRKGFRFTQKDGCFWLLLCGGEMTVQVTNQALADELADALFDYKLLGKGSES